MSGGAPPAPYRPVRGVRTHPGRAAYRAGRGAGLRRPSQCAAVRSWPLVPGTRHMCVQGRGGRASDQTLFSLPPRNDPIPTGGRIERPSVAEHRARRSPLVLCCVPRGCSANVLPRGPRGVRGRWGDRALRGWGGARRYRALRGGRCRAGCARDRWGCWARRGRGVPYGVAAVASPCGSWAARHVVRTAREPRGATWPRRYSPSRYVWGTATRRGIFQRRVVRGDATSRRTYGATRTRAARRDGATWRSRRDVSPARQRAWSSPRDVSPGSAGGPRRGRERRCRTRDRRPASRRGPRCRSRFPSRSRPRPSFPCRGGCRCASR